METRRDSYFGQGLKMFRPAVLLAVAGVLASWQFPDLCLLDPRLLQPLRALIGWMFVIVGTVLYFWGLFRMVPAVKSGKLDTGGPFAIVRHPMYTGWILFLFPGIAMVSGVWLIFGSAIVTWVLFRKWVGVEEQSMLDRFGREYSEYARKVPALFPFQK